MKKRVVLAIVLGTILSLTTSSAVFAGSPSPPDYGIPNPIDLEGVGDWVEKALPSTHIVTDPLSPVEDGPDAEGWVTFWCESTLGFQYNIGTTGLERLSWYSVKTYGVKLQIVSEGTPDAVEIEDGLWVLWPPVVMEPLDLGTFKTDVNGSGGVRGVARLQGGYAYMIWGQIFDISGDPVLVLESPPGPDWPGPGDPNGFLVY